MKSRDKLLVRVGRIPQFDDKLWVKVKFYHHSTNGEWIPSLEDLFRIIRAIAYCEDGKYPPGQGKLGRYMLLNFLRDAITSKIPYEELASQYMIPRIGE